MILPGSMPLTMLHPFKRFQRGSGWCLSSTKNQKSGEDADKTRQGGQLQGPDPGGALLCPAQGRIYGGRMIFVRGNRKVIVPLMFGVLAIQADPLLKSVT